MTSSSNSSPKKTSKLVILHGLNNNLSCFKPLSDALSTYFDTELVRLPGHGNNREEAKDLPTALSCLEKRMSSFDDYYLLSFSNGALLTQLLLRSNRIKAPKAQVLLAPSLAINYAGPISFLATNLPGSFMMKSFMPKMARNRNFLFVWEYRTLIAGVKEFQTQAFNPSVPTHVVIDPLDELVDAQKLKELMQAVRFKFWPRPYLKNNRGHHHLLFHPDYFRTEEWCIFLREMTDFLLYPQPL